MPEILKQWELPNNSQVKLSDGRMIKFLKMDGIYAHWIIDGGLAIANFNGFKKDGDHYKVIN